MVALHYPSKLSVAPATMSMTNVSGGKEGLLSQIVESETTYVEDLRFVIEEYMKPLKSTPEKYGLDRSDIMVMFYNIALIKEINDDMLQKFELVADGKGQLSGFGQVFLDMSDKLMTYHQYCDNHEKAQLKLAEKTQSSSKFSAFIQQVEAGDKKRNLNSLLERPVLRAREYAGEHFFSFVQSCI